jgi:hypothetical protein
VIRTGKINSLNFNTFLKINKETSNCMLEEGIFCRGGLDPDLFLHWNKGSRVFKIYHRLTPNTACTFRLQSSGVTSLVFLELY